MLRPHNSHVPAMPGRNFRKPFISLRAAPLVLAALLPIFAPLHARGQYTESVLYSFCAQSGCADGDNPRASLIFDSHGSLYGTTVDGGNSANLCGFDGCGVAFVVSPPSGSSGQWSESVLYAFAGREYGDGLNPEAALIFDARSNLYGTTEAGGQFACPYDYLGCGTLFELSPPADGSGTWTESQTYSFRSTGTGGFVPLTSPVFDSGGNLYGTAKFGGDIGQCLMPPADPGGCGVVFELSPSAGGSGGWTETVLYAFQNWADGAMPVGSVIFDSAGNLFGVTARGGASNCADLACGTVFELSPPPGGSGPWTKTTLYAFPGEGLTPNGNLIFDSHGNLYGTIQRGGAYDGGVVFELSPPASGSGSWTETDLYSFCSQGGNACTDGDLPMAGVIFDSRGNLYGTTASGGLNEQPLCMVTGCGVVFELSPPGPGSASWTETVLYNFCSQGGNTCTDGAVPVAGLIFGSDGSLYGTAGGGVNGGGTVFELAPLVTKTSTALASSANPSTSGEAVTFAATVFSEPGTFALTGGVNFTAGGDAISGCTAVPLAGFSAKCTTSSLPVGINLIAAIYSGDNFHGASVARLAQVVNAGTPPQLQLAASSGSIVLSGNQPGSMQLTLGSTGQVSSSITFACSGFPGACTFSPATVSGSSLPANVTVTFALSAQARAEGGQRFPGAKAPSLVSLSSARLKPCPHTSELSQTICANKFSLGGSTGFGESIASGSIGCGGSTGLQPCDPGTMLETGALAPVNRRVGRTNSMWQFGIFLPALFLLPLPRLRGNCAGKRARRIAALAVIGVGSALLVSGCGGGSGQSISAHDAQKYSVTITAFAAGAAPATTTVEVTAAE